MKKIKFLALTMSALLSVNFVWGADPTITEDFEKQEKGTAYQGQITYESTASNAGIGWFVEHGTVSETAKLSGEKSMHMRAYYAASSNTTTWNGALPYTNTTTAIKGLKSVSFSIAVSNTGIKYDTYYSTNGSTWTAIQTAQTLSNTSATTKSFTIPNSDANTSYYIKIGANSGSTHTNKPSNAGNYTFRIDDVVFTYASAPTYTVTAQSNNTDLGTVSGTTTITASPEECVGYANPAYTVAPAGKATVAQSGNTFTISNVTADVTVTINFAALAKDTYDTYEDHLHGNATIEKCGSYTAPSLDDATKPTTEDCDVVHYHFAGWVTNTISTGTPAAPDDMVTAGTAMNSNGAKYIAVWAKEK